MLSSELRKFPFFKLFGAVGIVQESPNSIKAAFKYLNRELNLEPRPLLNLYPQGKLLPSVTKEFILKDGLRLISDRSNKTLILPVYFHEESGRRFRSSHFLKFASPITLSEYKQDNTILQKALNEARVDCFEAINQLSPEKWLGIMGGKYLGY
jgi:hypothetical protein